MSALNGFKAWAAHAFAIDEERDGSFDDEEQHLACRFADFVVERRMTTPALMLLESGRPFNFVGSQFLAFMAPFVTLIFASNEYDRFVGLLEKRQSVDLLIDTLTDTMERREENRHD